MPRDCNPPKSFNMTIGLHMPSVTTAARAYESTLGFKIAMGDELKTHIGQECWEARVANPFEHGLVYDEETGSIEDGHLVNWINLTLEECGIPLQASKMEDSGCHWDRDGCWHRVRTYLLDCVSDEGEHKPYTAEVATRRYLEEQGATREGRKPVARSTASELAAMRYRISVSWRSGVDKGDLPDVGGSPSH